MKTGHQIIIRTFAFINLFLFIGLPSFGQNFLSSEKQWNVRLTNFPGQYTTEIFRIDGDSSINSVVYHKLWSSHDSSTSWSLSGLVREESDVVYFLLPGNSEGILYDFNLVAGDSAFVRNIFCFDDIPLYVVDVDTIVYMGVARKRWQLEGEYGLLEYWVEGIGSLNGPVYTAYWHCVICPAWELLCYHEDDTLMFMLPGQYDCYQNTVGIDEPDPMEGFNIRPNPVKRGSTLEIDTPDSPWDICIFNSTGLLINRYVTDAGTTLRIETGDLSTGLYLVRMTTPNHPGHTHKVLIE